MGVDVKFGLEFIFCGTGRRMQIDIGTWARKYRLEALRQQWLKELESRF